MADIFLSYAREDAAAARELADGLRGCGWTVWSDENIRTSADWETVTERELDLARCVVVLWTRSSIGSQWVRAEAGAADEQGKLVPVRFDREVLPPLRFRGLQVSTLTGAGQLDESSASALSTLGEIARLTGKTPRHLAGRLGDSYQSAPLSGAQRVTAGKWLLTTRVLGGKGRYNLNLHPNGMVSGRGSWFVSRANDLAGRWYYDAAEQVLQLEMSGGISTGVEMLRVDVLEWLDGDTAKCRFQGRKAKLERQTR